MGGRGGRLCDYYLPFPLHLGVNPGSAPQEKDINTRQTQIKTGFFTPDSIRAWLSRAALW